MTRVGVAAKVNLALVVGGRRQDGLHEVATVLQRIDLCDRLELKPAGAVEIDGFAGDTLVRKALERLASVAGIGHGWRVRIEKRIPIAAGLGGGSADAAAALVLANRTLADPLPVERLLEIAAATGSDAPFFLDPGPKLAEGFGERLTPLDLPQDYWVVVALPEGAAKRSTAEVYARFDDQGGGSGFCDRRRALLEALACCRDARDLAALPPNDLAEASGSAAFAERLREAGAFRADVSGAGPAVYGLFYGRRQAAAARSSLRRKARVWTAAAVW